MYIVGLNLFRFYLQTQINNQLLYQKVPHPFMKAFDLNIPVACTQFLDDLKASRGFSNAICNWAYIHVPIDRILYKKFYLWAIFMFCQVSCVKLSTISHLPREARFLEHESKYTI